MGFVRNSQTLRVYRVPGSLKDRVKTTAERNGLTVSAFAELALGFALDGGLRVVYRKKLRGSDSAQLGVRIPSELAERVKERAKAEGPSQEVFVANCLESALLDMAQQGLPSVPKLGGVREVVER